MHKIRVENLYLDELEESLLQQSHLEFKGSIDDENIEFEYKFYKNM